ncbi:MAG: group II truncated hemoglobin [Gammaproteobacteria bacterium]
MNENDITPYERLGGEDGVRRLVDLFYDHMDSLDEVRTTRDLHAKSLKGSRRKLFMFLSGWLGGPNLYIEKYGHPRLRARHLPFSIGSQERDEWMLCMRRALDDMALEEAFRAQLEAAFASTADFMRNRNEDDGRLNVLPAGRTGS